MEFDDDDGPKDVGLRAAGWYTKYWTVEQLSVRQTCYMFAN